MSIQREPNFHEVAQKMGKTVLRPGGSEATKHIQAMADIHPGDSVLNSLLVWERQASSWHRSMELKF